MTQDLFMVFDVESIGLHGEGFAVAYVVVNRARERLDEAVFACDPGVCFGTEEGRLWVAENVPPLEGTSPNPTHLRNAFWDRWLRWKNKGAVLVADCCWPVEARFLAACVDSHHSEREWEGPYPLYDLASVLLAHGEDSLKRSARLTEELPAHHPLHDARQTARLFLDALETPNSCNG